MSTCLKTTGIVLSVRPWSRTSHVVTWLTPEVGPLVTAVKGAVRPKSAFLGQYDFFYTCELVYYAHSRGEVHAIREAFPLNRRDEIRGDFRATALAGYAAYLAAELCPHNREAAKWVGVVERFLDKMCEAGDRLRQLADYELSVLHLSGLRPEFSGGKPDVEGRISYSLDRGHPGDGERVVSVLPSALNGEDVVGRLRLLGLFIRYHLDMPPEIRRDTISLISGGTGS